MDRKKLINNIRNFAIFVLLIAITFWLIFKDQDLDALWQTLRNSDWRFIVLGLLTMFIFMCMEALNIGRMLKQLGERSNFKNNLKYAFIGMFFSAITPAASGGQPMQIYYMHRDGISAGSSTITLLINITCVLFATITLSLFYLFFNYQYMNAQFVALFIFGTVINSIAIVLFLIAIFSEKTLQRLVNIAIKFLRKHADRRIKRIKKHKAFNEEEMINRVEAKYEKRASKLSEQVTKYKENAQIIKQNKKVVLKTLFIYYIQYSIFYLISYFSYRAVGLSTHTWFEVTSLQSIVYATVSGIPSPGAVGISEAVYIGLFKNIIPENLISSVMLLVRSMSFYIFVAIAGIVVVVNMIATKKREIN